MRLPTAQIEDLRRGTVQYPANAKHLMGEENWQDAACLKHKTVIFSKPLTSEPLIPWNSRNIHLTEQIEQQEKYKRR